MPISDVCWLLFYHQFPWRAVICLSRTLTSDKRFDFDPRKSSFMAKIDATAIKNWFLTLLPWCLAHLNEKRARPLSPWSASTLLLVNINEGVGWWSSWSSWMFGIVLIWFVKLLIIYRLLQQTGKIYGLDWGGQKYSQLKMVKFPARRGSAKLSQPAQA